MTKRWVHPELNWLLITRVSVNITICKLVVLQDDQALVTPRAKLVIDYETIAVRMRVI